ncbi:MAG TPA: hypothetical protein VF668_15890 [Pyrinomonadaceae bacterium]|jgi:hypothetical protein
MNTTRTRPAARALLKAAALTTTVMTLLLGARAASGQETFDVRGALRAYDLKVTMGDCGDEPEVKCSGPARVRVFKKGARPSPPLQTLDLPNVEVYRDTAEYNPATSPGRRALYAEEYSFVGEDFNFDGLEDLAVCNGRNGGYGGPSYTVFLFDRRSGRFAESRALSRLNEGEYLGLFSRDPKRKRLTTLSKSGCCYHETEVYSVVNNRPVLVEEVIEDATGAGEGSVLVTTRRKVKGRWVVNRRREKVRQ